MLNVKASTTNTNTAMSTTTPTTARYNRSEIMKATWVLIKTQGLKFGAALKAAWAAAKAAVAAPAARPVGVSIFGFAQDCDSSKAIKVKVGIMTVRGQEKLFTLFIPKSQLLAEVATDIKGLSGVLVEYIVPAWLAEAKIKDVRAYFTGAAFINGGFETMLAGM